MNLDFFGIGNAIQGMLAQYFRLARGTGRTTILLNSLKNGDRVIFSKESHKLYFGKQASLRGLKLDLVVIDPSISDLRDIYRLGTGKGRTVFDHSWIESYYLGMFNTAVNNIAKWEDDLSGCSRTHLDTRDIARGIRKRWGRVI